MGPLSQGLVVGDQHEGRARLPVEFLHEGDHRRACLGVQVPGGLVGEEDSRTVGEGSREGDPLLLPARQLGRVVVEAIPESHAIEQVPSPLTVAGGPLPAHQLQRHEHILECRQRRQQVEGLEDKAYVSGAEAGSPVFGEREDVFAGQDHPTRGGFVESRQKAQQGRLSGARWADHGDEALGLDLQVDTFEDGEGASPAAVGFSQIFSDDHMAHWFNSKSITGAVCALGLLACGSPPAADDGDSRRADADPAATASVPVASPREDDAGPRVVFLGTSLTAGLGLRSPSERWPELLDRMADSAGVPIRSVNAGRSGDTSAAGLSRLDWALAEPVSVMVVELGANDGLRGQPTSALADNLREVIERTRAAWPDAQILLIGMEAPTNLGAEYTARFRAVFAEVAEEEGVALVPFLLEGVAGVPELNQSDRIHPTAAGHARVAETVWPYFEPLIRAAAGAGA